MLETLKYLTQIQPPPNFKNINSFNDGHLYIKVPNATCDLKVA